MIVGIMANNNVIIIKGLSMLNILIIKGIIHDILTFAIEKYLLTRIVHLSQN